MVSSFNSVITFLKTIVSDLIDNFYLSSNSKVSFLALFCLFIPLLAFFLDIIVIFIRPFLISPRIKYKTELNDYKYIENQNYNTLNGMKSVKALQFNDVSKVSGNLNFQGKAIMNINTKNNELSFRADKLKSMDNATIQNAKITQNITIINGKEKNKE